MTPDESTGTENIDKRIEMLAGRLEEVAQSINVMDRNLSDVAKANDLATLNKKVDDLQQYVANLSGLEERFDDLAAALTETKEIVGIIVRQLDGVERKYNKALEDITLAVAAMSKAAEVGSSAPSPPVEGGKKAKKAAQETKEPQAEESVFTDALPSSVEGLMERLLKKVTPQTEAMTMSRALEEIRDKLTSMMPGHTPVLYQIGTIARELKSYPPTATLNENDIARLNKEIRTWTGKLKEMSKS